MSVCGESILRPPMPSSFVPSKISRFPSKFTTSPSETSPFSAFPSKLSLWPFRSPNRNCLPSGTSTMSVSTSPSPSPSKVVSSPWLMLPPSFDSGEMVYNFFSLAENKVVSFNKTKRGEEEDSSKELPDDGSIVVGSSHGWLALYNKRNHDLFLSNPLTGRHIKLPPLQTLPIDEKDLTSHSMLVRKVIISCSPDEDEEECRAMMMSFHRKLMPACCWPGRSSEWTPLSSSLKTDKVYVDFVYSSYWKLFFCITDSFYDFVEAWDLQDPRSPRMVPVAPSRVVDNEGRQYMKNYPLDMLLHASDFLTLVVAGHQIYIVRRLVVDQMAPDGSCYDGGVWRFPYKTIWFDVHKYLPKEEAFKFLRSSLNGLTFFLGQNHGFAISTKEFPELGYLKSNAIYFTDVVETYPSTLFDKEKYDYGGHDLGIFDYKKRTFSPCYYPCDAASIRRIQPAPVWFTPSFVSN